MNKSTRISGTQVTAGTPILERRTSQRIADYPFDSGDVVLRSSDNVTFHTHKAILSMASPLFKRVFSVQPPLPLDNPKGVLLHQDGAVLMTEASDVLEHLLRTCYPLIPPKPRSLQLVEDTLVAAIKYDMGLPLKVLKESLTPFLDADPLAVYSVGCRLKLEDVAQQAAVSLLSKEQARRDEEPADVPWESTLEHRVFVSSISAGRYFRLLSFLQTGAPSVFCDPPPSSLHKAAPSVPLASPRLLGDPDVVIQSCDNRFFPVRSEILALSSSSLALF